MNEQQADQSNLEQSDEQESPQEVENQNEEEANSEDSTEKEPDYKAEAEKLRAENERIKQQKLDNLTNPTNLSQLQERERAQTEAKLHNKNLRLDDLDGVDMDGLSLSQYDALMKKRLQTMYADITDNKVLPLKKEQERDAVNQQIKEAVAKYPDFWDYQTEMVEISRVHKSLPADDVYWLAKSRAGKLSAVDEKAIEKKVKKKIVGDSKAGISEKPGSSINATKKKMPKMSAKEAAASAYEELIKGR